MATTLEDQPTESFLGPLLRALAPALVVAAVVGMTLREPAAAAIGAGLTMICVGVALLRVIRSTDRAC